MKFNLFLNEKMDLFWYWSYLWDGEKYGRIKTKIQWNPNRLEFPHHSQTLISYSLDKMAYHVRFKYKAMAASFQSCTRTWEMRNARIMLSVPHTLYLLVYGKQRALARTLYSMAWNRRLYITVGKWRKLIWQKVYVLKHTARAVQPILMARIMADWKNWYVRTINIASIPLVGKFTGLSHAVDGQATRHQKTPF